MPLVDSRLPLLVLCILFCVGFVATATHLYPYGPTNRDETVSVNDDSSSGPVTISPAFTFFGEDYGYLYVSTRQNM